MILTLVPIVLILSLSLLPMPFFHHSPFSCPVFALDSCKFGSYFSFTTQYCLWFGGVSSHHSYEIVWCQTYPNGGYGQKLIWSFP
jgi:hypothetical protein